MTSYLSNENVNRKIYPNKAVSIAYQGCYLPFVQGINASKCFATGTSKTWWGAEADCKIATGFTGGIAEPRSKWIMDFDLSLKTGKTFYFKKIR